MARAEVYVDLDKAPVLVEEADSWKIDDDHGALMFEDEDECTLAAFNTWLYFRFIVKLDS